MVHGIFLFSEIKLTVAILPIFFHSSVKKKKTLWSFNQKHAINFISGAKIQYQSKSQCGQSPDWIELN